MLSFLKCKLSKQQSVKQSCTAWVKLLLWGCFHSCVISRHRCSAWKGSSSMGLTLEFLEALDSRGLQRLLGVGGWGVKWMQSTSPRVLREVGAAPRLAQLGLTTLMRDSSLGSKGQPLWTWRSFRKSPAASGTVQPAAPNSKSGCWGSRIKGYWAEMREFGTISKLPLGESQFSTFCKWKYLHLSRKGY